MSQETFKGSCLCGAIEYEASGDPIRFYHCHCSRCRKATGTGHATNIMIKTENFSWLKGSELLRRYDVPEAERFYTHFCSQCGSGMPREVPELGVTVIPAGSLDNNIAIEPQARIFWTSRTDWSCNSDELPTFEQYPPTNT